MEAPFSEEEVNKAIFESFSDGAQGPDGLSFMFYQHFWELVKGDLLNMFKDFHEGSLDIFRINFAAITLIPKESGAGTMNKFRPISLLNCSYKIFTKVLTNRINLVANILVSSNQSAFIKGRFILESVVTAHEVIYSVHNSGGAGVVLTLDYEKAYNKVNWEFLLEVLEKRGFGGKWIMWIRSILHNGSVGVTVNSAEGNYFETRKVLRQGDLLSPILFNLVVDVLTKMLKKAADLEYIKGLGVDFFPSSCY